MPLVLVHNDIVMNPDHAWDDVEGVHYHYPSKYQKKIQPGEPFVYYRGVNRVDGRRGQAQYVGAGRVGRVWLDPKTASASRKAWYCAIEDYERFSAPVPAKIDGVTLEDIPPNFWRDGVRTLDLEVYRRILNLARAPAAPDKTQRPEDVRPELSDNLVVPAALAGARSDISSYRKSKRAKEIGDWAETIVMRHLVSQVGCSDYVHRAAIGETPGWDIDFVDAGGRLQRVEVKGTIAAAFTGIELTAGEMRAAGAHGPDYWLYLVAGCLTATPRIQAIKHPAAYLASNAWSVSPTLFAVKFIPPTVRPEGGS